MTRKNYIAFAKSFSDLLDRENNGEDITIKDAINYIALDLIEDNPRFDYDKFYKACGLKS